MSAPTRDDFVRELERKAPKVEPPEHEGSTSDGSASHCCPADRIVRVPPLCGRRSLFLLTCLPSRPISSGRSTTESVRSITDSGSNRAEEQVNSRWLPKIDASVSVDLAVRSRQESWIGSLTTGESLNCPGLGEALREERCDTQGTNIGFRSHQRQCECRAREASPARSYGLRIQHQRRFSDLERQEVRAHAGTPKDRRELARTALERSLELAANGEMFARTNAGVNEATIYEERITVGHAGSFNQAFACADTEARKYAERLAG